MHAGLNSQPTSLNFLTGSIEYAIIVFPLLSGILQDLCTSSVYCIH